jgi:isoleucyl-tRNA synthetase
MYRPVPAQVDLPAMEREVLAFWREHDTFAKSLTHREGAPLWVFYEGPPTANGMPGVHHIEARFFKDVFPRFRTMKGYQVPRKAGWDCHGLPVELAVEKQLGFSGKPDIEAYGVAEFNARCREDAERHIGAWEEMSERMGYWVDMSQAYRTMDPHYVDAVWWSLRRIWDRGLLVQDHRVAPYCPRCGTTLSDHELAQGYETVVDPSVFVRCAVTGGPLADLGAALLVWTTTPWTLVSNTAVAVNPEANYVVARRSGPSAPSGVAGGAGGEVLVVAENLAAAALGDDYEVLRTLTGRELEHTPYRRPFELLDWSQLPKAHYVTLGAYVTTDEGSGLVHLAPAFGAEDLAICRAYGLPVVNPVRSDGTFEESLPLVGGQFFKHADQALVDDLASRGLLVKHVGYEHAYPHCWRCHTPLIYYAQPSWYIRTTAIKDDLLAENEKASWYPASIKWGRYGDWLRNNVDWALSRSRYWGTPLPIWECRERHYTCVESRAQLSGLAGRDLADLDPHRPYVDEVTFPCPECGAEARRVPEVIDVWYDSGAMSFAQWGYPHVEGSAEQFEAQFPAQFIAEALDQTRGWFYSMMAVPTLVFGRSSYENVVCLGLILDEEGRKMSKHLGNVLEPIPLMDQHGADAVRWFMAASGSPWLPRRIGHASLQEVVRKMLLTYWNTTAFQSLYARTARWSPADGVPPAAERGLLDRWVLSELHRLVHDVGAALEDFDTQKAGRVLGQFVDDLSNWYVRRSRRRFWEGDPAAMSTLHECLDVLTRLLAPFVPFITERVWQDLMRPVSPGAAESVHLADWPAYDPAAVDADLSRQMALVRRVVELGRAARTEARVRTRQPLRHVVVFNREWDALPGPLRAQAWEELNVASGEAALGDLVDVIDRTAKPNFRSLGRRFGNRTKAVAAAITAAEVGSLLGAEPAVTVDGERVVLEPDDFTVTETPRAGWAVAGEPGLTVALDLTMTPELRRAGLAREAIRLVQEARKAAGLDVTDRIALTWQAVAPQGEELAKALREHAEQVASEVLATSYEEGMPAGNDARPDNDLGLVFAIRKA